MMSPVIHATGRREAVWQHSGAAAHKNKIYYCCFYRYYFEMSAIIVPSVYDFKPGYVEYV